MVSEHGRPVTSGLLSALNSQLSNLHRFSAPCQFFSFPLLYLHHVFSRLWRYGATVSTWPFQGQNAGSIPASATTTRLKLQKNLLNGRQGRSVLQHSALCLLGVRSGDRHISLPGQRPRDGFEWNFSFGNGFERKNLLANDLYVIVYYPGSPTKIPTR